MSFPYISSLGSDPGRKIEEIHRTKVTVPQARNHLPVLQYLTTDCPDVPASLRMSLPSVSCSPCATLPSKVQGGLLQEVDCYKLCSMKQGVGQLGSSEYILTPLTGCQLIFVRTAISSTAASEL